MQHSLAVDPVRRYQEVTEIKANGATYTPDELAAFVADRIAGKFEFKDREKITILDPAVGDGALILALLASVRKRSSAKIEVIAFDTDTLALDEARRRIGDSYPDVLLTFAKRDFLQFVLEHDNDCGAPSLFSKPASPKFDLIIANPPYVRTQIMGAEQAQHLASAFDLTGRVDLYQAFLLAMAQVLSPQGAAGFIVSNRFMTTKGGGSLRAALRTKLSLQEIWDMGDTKLFNAAVLPAVIIANGIAGEVIEAPSFSSIYEVEDAPVSCVSEPIAALFHTGVIGVDDGRRFLVKHGALDGSGNIDAVWRIATASGDAWLASVQNNTWKSFGEIGKIRVGVKTCADKVFISHDWEGACGANLPELLRPLTTHHGAGRYRATIPKKPRAILYPHEVTNGRRQAVDLTPHPNSKRYLESHRATLEGRSYVIEGGRQWYELWVPQDPSAWAATKLVFRDISERPTFWIDMDGTIVNGDCYWMTTERTTDTELLWLAAAVANSTFAEAFYDHCFNNKLYAGRRRFITQYVEQFPLPNPELPISQSIIIRSKELYSANHSTESEAMEMAIDDLVWEAFGLAKEKASR